jgi:hypothetical protein
MQLYRVSHNRMSVAQGYVFDISGRKGPINISLKFNHCEDMGILGLLMELRRLKGFKQ